MNQEQVLSVMFERSTLISRCIEYGAAALAAARGLFEGEELLAQVRPSEDRLAQLIAEEEPEPDWLRSRAPAADWKAAFRANQTAITAPDVPTAALFDRLTVGVGAGCSIFAPGSTVRSSPRAARCERGHGRRPMAVRRPVTVANAAVEQNDRLAVREVRRSSSRR